MSTPQHHKPTRIQTVSSYLVKKNLSAIHCPFRHGPPNYSPICDLILGCVHSHSPDCVSAQLPTAQWDMVVHSLFIQGDHKSDPRSMPITLQLSGSVLVYLLPISRPSPPYLWCIGQLLRIFWLWKYTWDIHFIFVTMCIIQIPQNTVPRFPTRAAVAHSPSQI